ncbi:MAG: TIGR03663 family protein [Chloroflexi bacterium]|nr:TIGR03663 family protein [Chloroflexota bacterium]OJV95985.1 MAG: hypothetical protein BGO39_03895 [Chloroflexi bacterium 54-19]
MTEQARPFKKIPNRADNRIANRVDINRLDTLDTAAPGVRGGVASGLEAGRNAEVIENLPPRRSVLDSLIASGWLSWEKVFWFTIIALAIFTRMWDLSERAMHHDESIHGVFSYDMYRGKNVYRYDPTWHGPVLYYMVTLSYYLWGGASEFSARFAPAVFGIGIIVLCWFLRPLLGKVGAIALAMLVLISPSILYYSRSLRHDIFATFGMVLFVVGLFRYAQERNQKKIGWFIASGVGFFILFGSHEMSFLNLAIVVSWLGLIFLLEVITLPPWIRRPVGRVVNFIPPTTKPAQTTVTVTPTRKPLDDDDELDEPDQVAPAPGATAATQASFDDLGTVGKAAPDNTTIFEEVFVEETIIETGGATGATRSKTPADFVETDFPADTDADSAFERGQEAATTTLENRYRTGRYSYTAEQYTDPILGDFTRTWYGYFALLAVLVISGGIHLFYEKTWDGTLTQFLGVNAYLILLPFYLLLSALVAYPLARLTNLGYNRLSRKGNRIARFTALGVGVVLALVAILLFLRGHSPAANLAALGTQISGTSNAALNETVSNGFSYFTTISYFALEWPSIIPELGFIVIAAVLAGAIIGWLWERGMLVYTRRGYWGWGITFAVVFVVSSLVSLRFILGIDRNALPKVVLPLLGFIDKWFAYFLGGAILAVVIGAVIGWFISVAEVIPDEAVRGSAVLRTLLKCARNPWSIVGFLLGFGILYVLIFSNFFFSPERLADGFYRGIEYWLAQHETRRLDEPWFYYPMLMLLYETFAVFCVFIALVYFPVIFFRRTRRRERFLFTPKGVFIGLTFWWTFLALMMYSFAGEKIPWLNMQIALPASMATAAFLNDFFRSINWKKLLNWKEGLLFTGMFILMFVSVVVVLGQLINFPKIGQYDAGFGRVVVASDTILSWVQVVLVAAIGVTLFGLSFWMWRSGRLDGRIARASIFLVFGFILVIYCLKSSIALNYQHPDVAIEPMIYTQTTPEVPLFVQRLDRLGRDLRDIYAIVPQQQDNGANPVTYNDPANSKGLPVFMSTEVAWPLSWYFRDYTDVTQQAINNDANNPNAIDRLTDSRGNNFVVVLVSADEANNTKLQAQLNGQYTAQRFRFRWHFPEDTSGYRVLGYVPPDDTRNPDTAVKDIINTRWDLLAQFFTQQPYVGQIWRYIMYREMVNPLQSFDMVAYIRNDVYADFANTNGTTSPSGNGSTTPDNGSNSNQTTFDLTASTQAGNRDGQYRTPRNVTIAPNGDILVLDSLNGRVQRFDSTGKFLSKFGSIGSGDGQFGLAQYQSGPGGITTDDEGNIYVADTWGYRIEKFDSTGKFLLKWGSGKDTTGSVDGNAQNPTGFYGPRSIAFDAASGDLFITDTGNKRVVVYDKQGNFVRQFGSVGNGQGQFNEPVGLALGPDGNVYVADLRNKRVEVVDKQGNFVKEIEVPTWKEAVLSEPYLAFDPQGNLWVSDPANGAILKFDSSGNHIGTYNTASGLALLNPIGLTVAQDGTLYIADATKNSIVKFKPS